MQLLVPINCMSDDFTIFLEKHLYSVKGDMRMSPLGGRIRDFVTKLMNNDWLDHFHADICTSRR